MSLTPEDQNRILRQADAIRRLQQLPREGIAPAQVVKVSNSGYANIEIVKSRNPNPENWLGNLQHDCFWSLFEQGYEKYVESLKRIAETGEL